VTEDNRVIPRHRAPSPIGVQSSGKKGSESSIQNSKLYEMKQTRPKSSKKRMTSKDHFVKMSRKKPLIPKHRGVVLDYDSVQEISGGKLSLFK